MSVASLPEGFGWQGGNAQAASEPFFAVFCGKFFSGVQAMNMMRLARLTAVLAFAAMATGCMGVKVLHASQPVMLGAAPEGPQGRIALHIASDLPQHRREDIETGLRRKFQQQLSASGFQVIDIAQADKRDLVLRADIRQYSRTDNMLLTTMWLFSALIVPASGTQEFVIDTTLIREGEVLGTSRQALRTREIISLLPLVLLYAGPPSAAPFESHIELNRGLLGVASAPAGKGN